MKTEKSLQEEAGKAWEELHNFSIRCGLNGINPYAFTLGYETAAVKYSNRWISIEYKLPEEVFHDVLCTDGSWIDRGHKDIQGKLIWSDGDFIGSEYITHWMPLPELPKL